MKNTLFNAVLALLFGFIGAGIWSYSGLADARTKSYLLGNPQILPEMAEAYQTQEARGRLSEVSDAVMTEFPGAVMGNPNGSKVLVEFSDYNCGFCQKSHADVLKLIADDPEVKVVLRELPIFDEDAARMALAAAKQVRYSEFHAKMFEMGPANAESARAAAKAAGLDLAQAEKDAVSSEVDLELVRTRDLAQALGFGGTPSWVTKSDAFEGALGFEALKEALAKASADAEG